MHLNKIVIKQVVSKITAFFISYKLVTKMSVKIILSLAIFILNAQIIKAAEIYGAPSEITSWRISCNADIGAVKRLGNTYTFTKSRNNCGKETIWKWSQRSEIISNALSINVKAAYSFSTKLSVESKSNTKFTFFQVHDGRDACAPPLKIDWKIDNTLEFRSDFKMADSGAKHCVVNRSLQYSKPLNNVVLRRDGTVYFIEVILFFDGLGNFDVSLYIDGTKILEGTYSHDERFQKPRKFEFKHGSYSSNMFDYKLSSEGIKFKRID